MHRFNDSGNFHMEGPLRVEARYDGYHVVGKGRLIPISSYEKGKEMIEKEK